MPQRSLEPKGGVAARLAGLSHLAIVRLLVLLAVLIVALVASKIVSNPLIPPASSPLHAAVLALTNLFSAAVLLGAYAITVRRLEGRRASEIEPRTGAGPLVLGGVAGVGLMATVYLALWALGRVTVAPGTGVEGVIAALAAFFAAAVLEELVMRAVVFRLVEEVAGTTIAVIVSAMLFGLFHVVNPGATMVSTGAVAIEAGVLFALAYALTRNLWLCIGLHTGWNFAEGSMFGAQVSGVPASQTLVRTTLAGPDLLTGGTFGPEASLIAVGLFVTVSAILAVIVIRRAQWRPLGFHMRLA